MGEQKNKSCGSPTSGSSSRDDSARGTHQGSASAALAARNELKNQKTVRVQLSRPTEDMVPEPGAPKPKRRGSQVPHHHRAESNQASWHAPLSNYSLARTDSAMSVGGPVGGGGAHGASAWASEVLKEHKKRRSFIHIPSRSTESGNGNGNGSGNSLGDIFGDSERSSRASTCAALTTVDSAVGIAGVGVGGGRGRSNSASSSTGAGPGTGKHKKSASASSWSSLRGLIDDNNVAVDDGPERESGEAGEEVGSADIAAAATTTVGAAGAAGAAGTNGGGGVVMKKELDANAAKLQQEGVDEKDHPDRVLASERAVAGAVGAGAGAETTNREEGRGASASPPPPQGLESNGAEQQRDGEARAEGEAGGAQQGQADEMKDAEEGGPGDWAVRQAAAAPSTPGSKRRLVTEVIGDDDVDVSRPQDMDEGEVNRTEQNRK